jgi:hypothetical protein
MKTRFSGIFILTILTITMIACKQGGKTGSASGIDTISLAESTPLVHKYDTTGEGLPIFYNMYLTVEMSSLFQSSGAVYEQDLLNSPDRITDYITSSKKALNLGVYAVDLSYARIFEQLETAGKYFNAMQKMAEELGIPSDYFENTAKRFDRNINEKDSLIKIANEVYMATDNYLRENERYGAAAQIILGGWVEAIYIAVDIAEKSKDFDIIERLADQKVSLANVTDMLVNYKDDPVIAQFITELKKLQLVFDAFVVNVEGSFDPASISGKKAIQGFLVKIGEIGKEIKTLRNQIIE